MRQRNDGGSDQHREHYVPGGQIEQDSQHQGDDNEPRTTALRDAL